MSSLHIVTLCSIAPPFDRALVPHGGSHTFITTGVFLMLARVTIYVLRDEFAWSFKYFLASFQAVLLLYYIMCILFLWLTVTSFMWLHKGLSYSLMLFPTLEGPQPLNFLLY